MNELKYITATARWSAVTRRDPQADGHFVFSVKTTGVYCRPSCSARRALRKNVTFHDSGADAERFGFRPCKRCQPNGKSLTEEYAVKIAAACRTLETSEAAPSLTALAKAAAMSKFHFHRVFTKLTGLTPKAYAQTHRAKRMRTELPKRRTVTDAIYAAGFNSNSRFYAGSAKMLGMKPARFRQGGAGEVIRFTVSKCALGQILVAASERGLCAISLGDKPDQLVKDMKSQFPNATLLAAAKSFHRTVARVIKFVEAPKTGLGLPLDIRGTAFQRRVWQALGQIPVGTTSNYTAVARCIGAPKSVRAVAGACAANTLAVAIPCHRVLRSDGSLSGYRWGLARKHALLAAER